MLFLLTGDREGDREGDRAGERDCAGETDRESERLAEGERRGEREDRREERSLEGEDGERELLALLSFRLLFLSATSDSGLGVLSLFLVRGILTQKAACDTTSLRSPFANYVPSTRYNPLDVRKQCWGCEVDIALAAGAEKRKVSK